MWAIKIQIKPNASRDTSHFLLECCTVFSGGAEMPANQFVLMGEVLRQCIGTETTSSFLSVKQGKICVDGTASF